MSKQSSKSATEKKSSFPLWLHKASGNWAIKRKNRLYYLGKDKKEALSKYFDNQIRIEAGRPLVESSDPDEFTVGDACQRFLTAKQDAVTNGELSGRSLLDYQHTAERVRDELGVSTPVSALTRDDFTDYKNRFAKTRNPIGVGNEITRVKTIFKWCFENELCQLPRYGTEFKRPTKKVVAIHKRSKGKKLFKPEELRLLLDELGLHVRAMALLGINAGFGNSDCGNLPIDVVDLENGVIDWWRPKTGIDRRAILWPETVESLERSAARRPKPTIPEAKR